MNCVEKMQTTKWLRILSVKWSFYEEKQNMRRGEYCLLEALRCVPGSTVENDLLKNMLN